MYFYIFVTENEHEQKKYTIMKKNIKLGLATLGLLTLSTTINAQEITKTVKTDTITFEEIQIIDTKDSDGEEGLKPRLENPDKSLEIRQIDSSVKERVALIEQKNKEREAAKIEATKKAQEKAEKTRIRIEKEQKATAKEAEKTRKASEKARKEAEKTQKIAEKERKEAEKAHKRAEKERKRVAKEADKLAFAIKPYESSYLKESDPTKFLASCRDQNVA